MNAPDKIYVPQHNIEAGTIYELCEFVVGGSVEYIHKDALLEWAKEQKKILEQSADDALDPWHYFYLGRADFAQALIDKLNSM